MDIRTLSRATGAFCLIVGPASVALGSLFQQVHDGDSASTALRRIAAHPGAAHTAILFDVGAVAMIPAMLYLMRQARDRGPRLALIGGAVAFIGWTVGVASFVGIDVLQYHAAQAADHAAAVGLVDKVNHDSILGALVGVFVIGHLLGMLLLGIALWRARAVATWAAFLVAFMPLAHLAVHSIGGAVDAATYGLLAVGMIACAFKALGTPNDAWENAPRTLGGQRTSPDRSAATV